MDDGCWFGLEVTVAQGEHNGSDMFNGEACGRCIGGGRGGTNGWTAAAGLGWR